MVPLTYCGNLAKPRVIIPVFPGNNCEYDTALAFERAGAVPETFIINNLTPDAVAESTKAFVEKIDNSQIIMIPGRLFRWRRARWQRQVHHGVLP